MAVVGRRLMMVMGGDVDSDDGELLANRVLGELCPLGPALRGALAAVSGGGSSPGVLGWAVRAVLALRRLCPPNL